MDRESTYDSAMSDFGEYFIMIIIEKVQIIRLCVIYRTNICKKCTNNTPHNCYNKIKCIKTLD